MAKIYGGLKRLGTADGSPVHPFTRSAHLLLLLALAASSSPAAPADPLEASRPTLNQALTLQDAVNIALKESPVVRGAQEEVNAAIARVGVAKAGPRPALSATTTLSGGGMPGIYLTPSPVMPRSVIAAPAGSFANQSLAVELPLYTGGRLGALIRQAKAARGASGADLAAVRHDLVLETKTTYRQVLLAQAVADIYKALKETTAERLRIDRDAVAAGRLARYQVLRDEAEDANAQQLLINARRDVDLTLVMLKTVMGVSQDSQLTLTDTLAAVPETRTREELLTLAAKQRPELAAAAQRVAAASQGVTVARSEYLPQVSAMAMGDVMSGGGAGGSSGVAAGVVIGLPLLDGGRRRSQVNEAQAGVRQAQQAEEKVKLQVVKDVETARLSLDAARQSIETAKTALASAEEDYRLAQLRYTEGRGINVEVLDALAALTRARTNEAQALYDYAVARDQLARAVGEE